MFNSNDKIFDQLQLLEQYIFAVPNDGIKIISSIIKNKNPLKPKIRRIKGFGNIKGKSNYDLLIECIVLLERLRYLETRKAFNLLIKLFCHQNKDIQSKSLDLIKRMARYNLSALQQIKYKPQLLILDEIEKWSELTILKHFAVFKEVCTQFLNPSFEGSSWEGKTMIFRAGPLKATRELVDIRNRTIELLKKVYIFIENLEQKKAILSALEAAGRFSDRGTYSDAEEEMILENVKNITNFYLELLPKAENEIISEIEEQVSWFYRRFDDKQITRLKELKEKILKKDYQIFRILIGHEDRFSEKLNWEERREKRIGKIQEIIKNIDDSNFEKWQKLIFDILKNYNESDLGVYQYFNIFLNELATKKPDLAFKLLDNNKNIPFPFLVALASGILKSSCKEKGREMIKSWIEKDEHLDVCANVFSYDVTVDAEIISLLFKKAKDKKDKSSLNGIIRILANNYPKYKNKKLFIDTLKELTKLKDCFWVNDVWYQKNSLLDSLTKEDYKTILDNLLLSPRTDYHFEEIISFIAKDDPKLVIDFFYNRVKIQEKKKRGSSYDAIPFDLHTLGETLSSDNNSNIVIKEVLKWFNRKGWLYSWDAGNLLQAIFPVFNDKLETALLGLIKNGGKHNAKIVVSILDKYEGQTFLHKICQEFIKKYSDKKEYKNNIFHLLSKTGVVTGEYGFVDAYKKKKEEVQSWKKEKDKEIITFVKEYEDYLNKQIDYERKRADEQIELMKINFE